MTGSRARIKWPFGAISNPEVFAPLRLHIAAGARTTSLYTVPR
jgi:hypothetical protein